MNSKAFRVTALLLFSNAAWASAGNIDTHTPDLMHLSLEELMNVEVTSVSKRAEKLSEAPAAISVTTAEELRRSGVTSIPEGLRLVPGLEVARVDAHNWAISGRGFNDLFANKLLVLMDGRSVYTPLFSGVYWDVQDTLLEDIDRIEVIRGPGSTLWGANAVNGVINIITRPARDTQGLLLTGGGGTEEQGFGGLRYGGSMGPNAYYRVYARYFNRDDQVLPDGSDSNDRWNMERAGFRIDWDASTDNHLTLQGDLYSGRLDQTYFLPIPNPPFAQTNQGHLNVNGGNVLGRWSHSFSAGSDLKLQLYYDRTVRDGPVLNEDRDTFDIDLQHHFLLGERQDVVWGAGYRVSSDEIDDTYTVTFNPDQRAIQLFSFFGQDEITLVPDRLRLTLGSKFEHNEFTGFEYQPSVRSSWTPTDRQTVWASISRSVRTPSRAEEDILLRQLSTVPGVQQVLLQGNREFDSEQMLAYEAGYRWRPRDRISLDVAAFYHDYDHLRSLEPGGFQFGPPGPPVTAVFTAANKLHGETYGIEFAPSWQVTEGWRLQAAYTFLQMQLHHDAGSGDTTSERDERRSPHHQFSLRSSMDLLHNVEFDCAFRYVEGLPDFQIPSYAVVDVRLAWRPLKDLELAIVGQNLLDNRHPEFQSLFIPTERTEVQHSVYGKVTWRY